MKRSIKVLFALATVLLTAPVNARAELINIQFTTNIIHAYSGAGVIGSSGDTWNLLTSGYGLNNPLVNSASESISTTLSWGGASVYTSEIIDLNGFHNQSAEVLMNSYLYEHPTISNAITFKQLPALSSYDIYVYSQGDAGANDRILAITVNGAVQSTASADYRASTFIEGQNYLKISARTDNSGELSLVYSGIGEANINGMQLLSLSTPVAEISMNGMPLLSASAPAPEPSAFVLMGIGGLAGMIYLKKSSFTSRQL